MKQNPRDVHNVSMGTDSTKPKNTTSNDILLSSRKPLFVSVVHGSTKTKGEISSYAKVHSISLNNHDLIRVHDSSKVALVTLKEVDTMSSMYKIRRNEGFIDLKFYHVG